MQYLHNNNFLEYQSLTSQSKPGSALNLMSVKFGLGFFSYQCLTAYWSIGKASELALGIS